MITVIYANEDCHRLKIEGHAGYDRSGRDIICAAVSAITFSLLGWLESDGGAIYEDTPVMESGKTVIACRGDDRLDAAFDMALIGYLQIERQYPDYIKVIIPDDITVNDFR